MHIKIDKLHFRKPKGEGPWFRNPEGACTDFLSSLHRGTGGSWRSSLIPSALNCLQCPARAKIDSQVWSWVSVAGAVKFLLDIFQYLAYRRLGAVTGDQILSLKSHTY